MDSQGRQIHQQAALAREAGNFLESLKLSDEALISYQKDGDILGFAEILADRSITLRHLFEQSSGLNYLIVAKHEIMAGVEIAQKSGQKDALALPLFNLAKVQEELGEITEAVVSYRQAVENMEKNPPQMHNRPAVLLDMKVHLDVAQYRAGDKIALEKAETDLAQLENTAEISDYNKHVWVSGGHMHLAEALRNDNPQKAKEHLQKAKGVIDADPKLSLRKAQWEKLSARIG